VFYQHGNATLFRCAPCKLWAEAEAKVLERESAVQLKAYRIGGNQISRTMVIAASTVIEGIKKGQWICKSWGTSDNLGIQRELTANDCLGFSPSLERAILIPASSTSYSAIFFKQQKINGNWAFVSMTPKSVSEFKMI